MSGAVTTLFANRPFQGRAVAGQMREQMGLAAYNLAGASSHHANFTGKTAAQVASTVIDEAVDIATLQEVHVNTRASYGLDYNEELLQSIFVARLPQSYRTSRVERYSLDEQNHLLRDKNRQPRYDPFAMKTVYVATDEAGEVRVMKVVKESLGQPAYAPCEEAPTTIYSATMDTGEIFISVFTAAAFAPPADAEGVIGQVGVAVVLTPGHILNRQVIERHYIGEAERVALGVSFRTPRGHESYAISTRLTALDEDRYARNAELHELDLLAQTRGRRVLTGGNFVSLPSQEAVQPGPQRPQLSVFSTTRQLVEDTEYEINEPLEIIM